MFPPILELIVKIFPELIEEPLFKLFDIDNPLIRVEIDNKTIGFCIIIFILINNNVKKLYQFYINFISILYQFYDSLDNRVSGLIHESIK